MLADAAVDAELTNLDNPEADIDIDAGVIPPVDDADLAQLIGVSDADGQPSSPLEVAIDLYLKSPDENKTRIDNLAKLMFNDGRVRKICRLRALKNGVGLEEVDDVIQRMMVVFFMKMLKRLESYNAVYAVVYAVANNVSLEVSRSRFAQTSDHDSIEELKEKGGDIGEADHADYEEPDTELTVDSRIRKNRMALRLASEGKTIVVEAGVFNETVPLVEFVRTKTDPNEVAQAPVVMPKPKDGKKEKRELSVDQQALVDMIEELGMRNQDFAVMLGIGLPRLSSYIYGRTASVPVGVMADARRIYEEQKSSLNLVKAQFDKKMSEIIKDWEARLETTTNEELANYLGVTTMTIHRWRTDETRPDLTALVRYDQTVSRLQQQLQAAKDQMNRQVLGKK